MNLAYNVHFLEIKAQCFILTVGGKLQNVSLDEFISITSLRADIANS